MARTASNTPYECCLLKIALASIGSEGYPPASLC